MYEYMKYLPCRAYLDVVWSGKECDERSHFERGSSIHMFRWLYNNKLYILSRCILGYAIACMNVGSICLVGATSAMFCVLRSVIVCRSHSAHASPIHVYRYVLNLFFFICMIE